MTTTLTNTRTSTFIGLNTPVKRQPIGVIAYNTTTGQVRQCEVYSPFWVNSNTPDTLDCDIYLMSKGIGLVRLNTARYSPLV